MAALHMQVLAAACAAAGDDWTFRIADVTKALAHLNEGTVRTHVASRCCANAPANHQTRYRYFKAIDRGVYRVEPAFRRGRPRPQRKSSQDRILSSIKSGVDPTQIADSLAKTPTERLEMMQRAARALQAMRRQ